MMAVVKCILLPMILINCRALHRIIPVHDIEMSKRKISNDVVQKPFRKMRALSGYNLWYGEYLRSHGMFILLRLSLS